MPGAGATAMRRWIGVACGWLAILPVLLMVGQGTAAAPGLVGVGSVIDGDTLEIHDRRVRLVGIDAPESSQLCTDAAGRPYRCGQVAALALADRIGRQTVACAVSGEDRYGRALGSCEAGGVDLNRWLVREGLAVAYRRYATTYVPEEEGARAAGRGLWAGPFALPWDWRQAQSEEQAQPRRPRPTRVTVPGQSAPACGGKRLCRQMDSCAEAQFYLRQCGLGRLDGDKDGVPCEQLC